MSTVGETASNISRRLKQLYGDVVADNSTLTRWIKRINDGQEKPGEIVLVENAVSRILA